MPARHRPPALLAALLVLSALGVVHAPETVRAQAREKPPSPSAGVVAPIVTGRAGAGLPQPVADMREAILEAARSGRIEELRHPIELNELKPMIGDGASDDPIATLKRQSADGEGRDVLAMLERLLESRWAALPLGADIESNRIYVWPAFATTGLEGLSPEAQADLARLVPPELLDAMRQAGTYSYWRIGIGADGTWHSLTR